jgi:uncharacterized repeat protein (TIGR01451 family)
MRSKRMLLGLVVGIAALGASAPAAAQQLEADLSISKTGPAAAAIGADIVYILTVTNDGPEDSEFVSLIDDLSADVTFVSITQDSGPATDFLGTPAVGATGTVNADWDTFASGTSAVFTLTVNVDAAFTGALVNEATVNADFADPDETNNSATVTTQIAAQADLGITKTGPANGAPGANVAYTLTAINNGPNDAANVSLSDTLVPGVTFVSLVQNAGPAAATTTPTPGNGGSVTATWATLANGASATFTLTVNVGAGFSGSLLNSAVVTTATNDPNPANNTSTAALTVTTSTTSTTTTTTLASTTTSTTLAGGLPPTGSGSRNAQFVAVALLGAGVALIALASRRRMPNA